jgi:hypothetical protein
MTPLRSYRSDDDFNDLLKRSAKRLKITATELIKKAVTEFIEKSFKTK